VLYVEADDDPLGVADLVREVLTEALDSENAPPLVGIQDFAYGGVAIGVRYWAPSTQYFQTRYDMNAKIKQALDEAGIKLLKGVWPEMMAQPAGDV
jgi:small conductance mechanosensitive channel